MNQAKKAILPLFAFLALTAVSNVEQTSREFVDQVISSEGRLNLSAVDQHYDQLVLSETLTESINYLDQLSQQGELNDSSKAKIHLTLAHWQWHRGERDAALTSVNRSLEFMDSIDGQFLKARILDASGKSDEAAQWYTQVANATTMEAEREMTRVRLAMIDVNDNNVESLIQLANSGDQEQKNRVAIVLAVLGHVESALTLYRPDPASPRYINQLLKRTEWSIAVEDFESAQESAWKAYDGSIARIDRLYALALTEESYQKADAVPELLAELNRREPLEDELRTLQIDQFIQLQEYDDAIELYQSLTATDSSIEARQRLLKLYGKAQRYSDLETEYLRLIDEEPKIVEWYSGLASHYLVMDEPEKVRELWGKFATQNLEDAPVLVQGAESMLRFGLESEAIQYVQKHLDEVGSSIYAFMFLFETHLDRGREGDAKEAIERLAQTLSDDSKDLRTVADAYERINDFGASRDIYLRLEEALGKLSYDERNRLAWLHSVSGDKQRALDLYKEIWVAASSPARRSFAESQLLLLAAELNLLGDLAIELEQKLFKNEANKNELNLLVRIYSEVGDEFSATEVIEEFARAQSLSRVDLLKQLASTYLQMLEYAKYDQILRELVEIDSEDRVEHIQNIILNIVTLQEGASDAERLTEIQKWVERLRAFDSEAVNSEFLANVLAMSGYVDEAIQSYQNALIEQPTHSDNLLLMADLLQNDDRTVEAVNMLQYIAEHASNDNEFIVAIDGIINMIGQSTFGQTLSSDDKATFKWAFRIILERIATRADKIYLYSLLSEIAQEVDDKAGEYSAIENAISLAGLRRPAFLRELFTMATPGAGYSFLDRNIGDPSKQLLYGRRLIGLRQQLPPSVFIELGKTLLDQGEFLGAERAFEQINDITGMIDVPQTKADLYFEAGYSDQSMEYYAQAQALDQTNVELQIKTAFLRQLLGYEDVAHFAYLTTLGELLRSQPIAVAESDLPTNNPNIPAFLAASRDQSVTHDYKTFYEFLVQGVLTTMDSSDESRAQLSEHARSMFDHALEVTIGNQPELSENLSSYSRLNTAAKHARRIAHFIDDSSLSRYVNDALISRFSEDQGIQTATLNHRNYWYAEKEDGTINIDSDEQNLEETINRWMLAGTDHTKYQQAIYNAYLEQDIPKVLQTLQDYISEGYLYQPLSLATQSLPDNELKRFISMVVNEVKSHPSELIRLLINRVTFVKYLEERLQAELISTSEIMELLQLPSSEELVSREYFSVIPGLNEYITNKGNTALTLEYLSYVISLKGIEDAVISQFVFNIYGKIIAGEPLSTEESASLLRVMQEFTGELDFSDEYTHARLFDVILIFNMPEENYAAHIEMANYWIDRIQKNEILISIITSFKEGNYTQTLDYILENMKGASRNFYRYMEIVRVAKRQMRSTFDDKFKELSTGKIADKDVALAFYQIYFYEDPFTGPGYIRDQRDSMTDTVKKKIELLRSLIRSFPEDDNLRRRLILTFVDSGNKQDLETALADYYRFDPSDEYVRAAYYHYLTEHEHYAAANRILSDEHSDLSDPNVMQTLRETIASTPNTDEFSSGEIFKQILKVEDESRAGFSRTSKSTIRAIESLVEFVKEKRGDNIPSSVISLWRKLQLDRTQEDFFIDSLPTTMLGLRMEKDRYGSYMSYFSAFDNGTSGLPTSFDSALDKDASAAPAKLLAAAIQVAPLALELEKLFKSIPIEETNNIPDFYDLLKKAYDNDERAASREQNLYEQLQKGDLNSQEFLFWMILRLNNESEPTEEEIDLFTRHVNTLNQATLVELPLIASLFAKFNLHNMAAQIYMFTANAILSSISLDRSGAYQEGPADSLISLLDLCIEVKANLPDELAADMISDILDAASITNTLESTQNAYRAFYLDVVHSLASDYPIWSSEFKDLDKLRNNDSVTTLTEAPVRIKLARYEAMNVRYESALDLIRPLLQKSTSKVKGESFYAGIGIALSRSVQIDLINLSWVVRKYGVRSWPIASYAQQQTPQHFLIAGQLQLIEDLDEVWHRHMLDHCFMWLDEDDLVTENVAEFLMVYIHELYQIDPDLSTLSLVRLADWLTSNENLPLVVKRQLLKNTSLLALQHSTPLPLAFVSEAVRHGGLKYEDEVRLLEMVSKPTTNEFTNSLTRFGDVDQKGLSFLTEFQRLANESEVEINSSIQARIDTLIENRTTLGL